MQDSSIQSFSYADGTRAWHETVNLTNCDREPVQFLGAIMPHGVMLILAPGDYRILGASANANWLTGGELSDLWGKSLDCVVAADVQQLIEKGLAAITHAQPPRYLGCFRTLLNHEPFDVLAHRSGDGFVLEFEALPVEAEAVSPTARLADITDSIAALRAAETWQDGMAIAVRELKRMTGCDSVIGAYFLADGSGQALAEACEADFPSFLDKRFPRSDIPEPGRRQMLLMPVQYAPEHSYEPIPLVMANPANNPHPIDLSFSALRSMSRMCSQYYLNINARARLLLSLTNEGKLWGFFSCLSATPKRMRYCDRLAYQTFSEMATLLFVEKAKAEQHRDALNAKRQIMALNAELSADVELDLALSGLPAKLVDALDIAGTALCLDNQIIVSGNTPPEALIRELLPWLGQQEALFVTDRLPSLFAPAEGHADTATGLLAVRLMEAGQYLLNFRPEWRHEIKWAGDPRKPVEVDASNGEERLTPRGSFEVWKEVVRGTARPWQAHEVEAITDLQSGVMLLQLAEQQKTLRMNLEQSNAELEAFAYIVSHDLQEPLRGIVKSAYLLHENPTGHFDEAELAKLDSILKLSTRMSELIEAVLKYSHADQKTLDMQAVDLNLLLQSLLDGLSARTAESGAAVEVQTPLPEINGDPIAIAAVFQNLIVNAIKYNDSPQKRIEIGHIDEPASTFFVRDNGIGIPESHQENIFRIFRRLHGPGAYGGGTGAGLAIVRKHIERHGGKLWLESTPGEGSTFFFSFGQ